MTDIIYLACPYTSPDEAVRNERQALATKVAAYLMQQGNVVFSPITHGHAVAAHLPAELTNDGEFWMVQCLPVLERCSVLVILPLPGWEKSKGIAQEVRFALERGMDIAMLQNKSGQDYEVLLEPVSSEVFIEHVKSMLSITEPSATFPATGASDARH